MGKQVDKANLGRIGGGRTRHGHGRQERRLFLQNQYEDFGRRSLTIKGWLRFCRQRTEPLVCLHHVRLREASGDECFRQSFVRLPGVGRKANRDPASRFHDAPYFSQSSHGVRPDLHRVDGQRLINAVVIEWQAHHGTVPQVDATALDSGRVPSASLLNHLPRLIDARDMPRCRQLRKALNNQSGSELQGGR